MNYAVLVLLLISVQCVLAQPKTRSTTPKKTAAVKVSPTPTPTPLTEKEQFEKASSPELAAERVAGLEKFLEAFPESENRPAAVDLLTSSRALIAEEKLISGDPAGAVAVFKQVVEQAPQPIPNELYNEAIAKIPSMLFRHNQRSSAFELANLIESKVEENAAQLLEIANFYISIENGGDAMRVAAKAAAKDPTSAPVYRTLALAQRINFDLESAATSYARALELDPDSPAARRGLAEMKRALGKSEEALVIYRELLGKNEGDVTARTGVVLSLFDAGKKTEAEAELAVALERAPGNFVLLAGAAYWYASRGLGDKAIELAEKALAREPRYIWSHIALARGLIAKGKPAQAEQVLFRARAHGNFPTLEYELASARVAAGFYREAVDDLSKQFSVVEGGVKTNLGGRVTRVEKSLTDLVAYERRASIFAPSGAESIEAAETLRALLELDQKLQSTSATETEVVHAVDAFVKGTDKMKVHRQLFAANLLLQKRTALPKVLDLTKAVTGNTDAALEVADAAAAVMASELYESRIAAFRKNEILLVPDVAKPTLSAILRGRVEELAGWALYHQGSYAESVVRLRRAITVMPDKSAWWRSSMWRLGAALAADGKDAEALDAYIESYKTDKPDFGKYAVVESLYRKVNGSTDGLEAKIGADRVAIMRPLTDVTASPTQTPDATPAGSATANQPTPITNEPPVSEPKAEPAVSDVKLEPERGSEQPKADTNIQPAIPEQKSPVIAAPAVRDPAPTVPTSASPSPLPDQTKTDTTVPTTVTNEPEKAITKIAKPVVAEETPVKEADKSAAEIDKPVGETEKPKGETEKAATETRKLPEIERPVNDSAKPESEVKGPDRPPPAEPEETRPKSSQETTRTERAAGKSSASTRDTRISSAPSRDKKTADTQPLFEPIIITIPRPPTTSGAARVRLVDGLEVKGEEPPCKIGLSQDRVSLINDGGTVGILVNLEGSGDIKRLTATSSSPKDVTATLEPEIGGMPDRRFFIIKSISPAVGVFQVTFAAPCGRKDLTVTIR